VSAAWVVQALLAAVLMSVAALAAERVAVWIGAPARGAWAAAMSASVALAAISLCAPGALPDLGILPDGPPAIRALDEASIGAFPYGSVSGFGTAGAAVGTGLSAGTVLLTGWMIATAAMLLAVGWTYSRFRRVRDSSSAAMVGGVPVRVAEHAGPAVMGLLRPEIVLPRWVLELPPEERELIVLHEHEHLSGRDSWLLFAGTVAVALMPWCFSLWWQHRRLRQAIETDCDARVLARGANLRSYGQILIRTASSTPGIPLLNPAWGEATSQLERRIMSMTAKRPRHPLLRSLPLVALTLGIIATACDVAGRSGSDPELATAPADQIGTVVVGRDPNPDPLAGDLGIQGMSWPDHGGPSFAENGDPRPPTSHAVIGVVEGRSAWNAGLRDGDVLLAVNGRDTRTMMYPFPDRHVGTRYTVRVRRDSEEHEFAFEVAPSVASAGI
jgi:bla regulator protein blaR1